MSPWTHPSYQGLKPRNKRNEQAHAYFLHGFLKISSMKLIVSIQNQKSCQKVLFLKMFSFFLAFSYVYCWLCIFNTHVYQVAVFFRFPA